MNHTPAPWERVANCIRTPYSRRDITGDVEGGFLIAECSILGLDGSANADHIVRCVNVHYELVAALEVIALNSADILAGGPNNAAAEHLRIASCALAMLQS